MEDRHVRSHPTGCGGLSTRGSWPDPLEMANHVANGNIKLVVHVGAFLTAIHGVSALCVSSIGFLGLRRKLRRDQQRQA